MFRGTFFRIYFSPFQWSKSPKKQSVGVYFWMLNNKNALLQTVSPLKIDRVTNNEKKGYTFYQFSIAETFSYKSKLYLYHAITTVEKPNNENIILYI